MKTCFEEPNIEVIRFSVENAITTSGMRTGGGNPGFDEIEPDMNNYMEEEIPDMVMIPPCG